MHVRNMHSPHVNLHGLFGDVSDLNKHGSAEDEVQGVSHCGQKGLFGHNQCTLTEQNPGGPSRAMVNNTGRHRKFGKEKMTSSVLHPVEDASPYTLGTTSANPHGFQTYENTLFQARGCIPPNIEASCFAYTENASTYTLGPTTRNPVHVFQTYENTLFQTRGSIPPNIQAADLAYTHCHQSDQLERTMHPLTTKGHLWKRKASMPGQGLMLQAKRRRDAATSSFMLQPNVPDPAVVTNVAGPSSNREEEQHMSFQTAPSRPQQNSRRRHSNGQGVSPTYIDIGDADWRCHWCGVVFWFGERLKGSTGSRIRYSRCCREGNVRLQQERDPPDSIKHIFKDKHFMENIRAYNQMFSMTSFGAQIDETVNNGRGPYVFKVSGRGQNSCSSTYMTPVMRWQIDCTTSAELLQGL
ncbi:hypothetical protein CTI12_AA631860 [Artemisia annua]|uniref:Helitron helicase-like domain-containing protein n=1 Tax=Artemisia annua TaxID=35608 RepID=A0A2U1K8J7_ARTAN|nr:hypothetical protein CTI12_AA631860 [Artemisia annua]